MSGEASTGVDWNVLAGKAGKYVAAFTGVMIGLVGMPMFSEQSSARLLVAFGLAVAAVLALLSGRSLLRKADATEGAARLLVGLLFALGAIWFSNLMPSPKALQAPAVAGRVNDAIRTVAYAAPRQGLDRTLSWTVYTPEPSADRLQAPLEGALAAATANRPLPDRARRVSAGVRVTGRSGSLAGGQVTAGIRVALAAQGAPQCVFAINTPRPMPVKAATEWLADQAVNRAQTYVEGSDAC